MAPLSLSRKRVVMGAVNLGSSKVSNSQDAEEAPGSLPRGCLGLSSRGRKMLRSAACLLERPHGSSVLSFATFTLPPWVAAGIVPRVVWPEILRRLCQSLREKLMRGGLPGEMFGCSEFQEGRAKREGRLVLHLHLCFQGRHRFGGWLISPKWLQRAWYMAVRGVVGGELAGDVGDWKASTQLARVLKSVGAYLGKYLSKGVGGADLGGESGMSLSDIPPAWYTISRSLSRRVVQETRGGEFLHELIQALVDEGSSDIEWSRLVYVRDGGGVVVKSFLCFQVREPLRWRE